MFCFLFFVLSLSDENKNTKQGDDPERVQYIMNIITKEADKCPINLTHSIVTYCSNINEVKRRNLAIQLMICEMGKDGRDIMKNYVNDEQFLSELNDDEFSMYTSFFTNIDSVCFQSTHEFQLYYSNQKVDEVSSAVNFSSDFLRVIGEKVSNQTQRSEDDLKEIENAASEANALLESIVNYVNLIWDDFQTVVSMTVIEKSIRDSIKLYVETLILTFIGAFILPNILPTIVSLTILCIYLEFEFSNEKYTSFFHTFYVVMCIMICISSFWVRIVDIKRRMFDPIILKRSKSNTKLGKITIA